jgi:hypothetical protein
MPTLQKQVMANTAEAGDETSQKIRAEGEEGHTGHTNNLEAKK